MNMAASFCIVFMPKHVHVIIKRNQGYVITENTRRKYLRSILEYGCLVLVRPK
jgi:hypothetical protein